jgi:hypothetical protein
MVAMMMKVDAVVEALYEILEVAVTSFRLQVCFYFFAFYPLFLHGAII